MGVQTTSAVERMSGYRDGADWKTKVLVVDDERIIADTLATILNRAGYDAHAVYSGEAAVEALSYFTADVLVSDVMMPGMNGIEAAIAILKQRPHCKVLLLSGQAATTDLLCAARTQGHIFDLFAKPIHPLDLLDRLRTGLIN